MKRKKHWMKQAFNPAHKGRLHRALGVKEGEKIPASKLAAAKSGKLGPKVAKMANPVVTAKKINSKRRRKRSHKRS